MKIVKLNISKNQSRGVIAYGTVTSKSRPGTKHGVTLTLHGWHCSCEARAFNRTTDCRHIEAAKRELTRMLNSKPKPDADALREHMPPKIEYNLEDGPEVLFCSFFRYFEAGTFPIKAPPIFWLLPPIIIWRHCTIGESTKDIQF